MSEKEVKRREETLPLLLRYLAGFRFAIKAFCNLADGIDANAKRVHIPNMNLPPLMLDYLKMCGIEYQRFFGRSSQNDDGGSGSSKAAGEKRVAEAAKHYEEEVLPVMRNIKEEMLGEAEKVSGDLGGIESCFIMCSAGKCFDMSKIWAIHRNLKEMGDPFCSQLRYVNDIFDSVISSGTDSNFKACIPVTEAVGVLLDRAAKLHEAFVQAQRDLEAILKTRDGFMLTPVYEAAGEAIVSLKKLLYHRGEVLMVLDTFDQLGAFLGEEDLKKAMDAIMEKKNAAMRIEMSFSFPLGVLSEEDL